MHERQAERQQKMLRPYYQGFARGHQSANSSSGKKIAAPAAAARSLRLLRSCCLRSDASIRRGAMRRR